MIAKDILTGMYAAEAAYFAAGGPGRASFATLAPYFADDVVLYQAEGMPYGGIWRGHTGLERFFVAMGAVWESFDLLEQNFLATGTTTVVHTRVRARARATGRELEFPILQTIRLEDRRIIEVHPFYWDTKAIAEACAIPRRHP